MRKAEAEAKQLAEEAAAAKAAKEAEEAAATKAAKEAEEAALAEDEIEIELEIVNPICQGVSISTHARGGGYLIPHPP